MWLQFFITHNYSRRPSLSIIDLAEWLISELVIGKKPKISSHLHELMSVKGSSLLEQQ